MPILNFNINSMGQSGVTPSIIYINTSDTIATVTTAGYLNALSKANVGINDSDMALITTQVSPSSTTKQVKWYEVEKVGDNWSLVNAGSGIAAVVDDLTPELGGNLDGGTFDITNVTSLEALDLDINGTTLIDGIIDDDTMATASATTVATSESMVAYVDASATAATSGTNLLIGGNFSTNPWQRGTSFSGVGSGDYVADRFRWRKAGIAAVTISKTADAPTVAEAGIFTEHCLHVDVTGADGSVGVNDNNRVLNVIEGYDWAQIAQRAFTVTFWVKSTKTGIFCVYFKNSATYSYIAEYTVNTTDTWELKTVNVSASPAAGTWNYTNGFGLEVGFSLAVGTTYQTTADAWNAGNFYATANQVNALDSTSNNFKIALIQVEEGSAATPFEVRSRADELALCQRYYQKTYNQGINPGANTGTGTISYFTQTAGVSAHSIMWNRPVTMRDTPTMTYYGQTGTADTWYNVSDAGNSGTPATQSNGASTTVIANPQVAGDGVAELIALHATAVSEL